MSSLWFISNTISTCWSIAVSPSDMPASGSTCLENDPGSGSCIVTASQVTCLGAIMEAQQLLSRYTVIGQHANPSAQPCRTNSGQGTELPMAGRSYKNKLSCK